MEMNSQTAKALWKASSGFQTAMIIIHFVVSKKKKNDIE